jgi:hypothetical protein
MSAAGNAPSEVPQEDGSAAPDAASAPTSPTDEALLRRVLRDPVEGAGQPADVSQALEQAGKQFQLWNIRRQEIEPSDLAAVKRERIERIDPVAASSSSEVKNVLAEATKALSKFVPASALAKKGFTGFKALKRVVINKPYKQGG